MTAPWQWLAAWVWSLITAILQPHRRIYRAANQGQRLSPLATGRRRRSGLETIVTIRTALRCVTLHANKRLPAGNQPESWDAGLLWYRVDRPTRCGQGRYWHALYITYRLVSPNQNSDTFGVIEASERRLNVVARGWMWTASDLQYRNETELENCMRELVVGSNVYDAR